MDVIVESEHRHQPFYGALPDEVSKRRNDWFRHFKFWRRFHYSIGTLGAIVSTISATAHSPYSQWLAGGAAVIFAWTGFTHPERNYLQFVSAWRVLDAACKRYQYDHAFSLNDLLQANENGEKILSELEYTFLADKSSSSPPDRAKVPSFAPPAGRSRQDV